jgi:hypothetical protein
MPLTSSSGSSWHTQARAEAIKNRTSGSGNGLLGRTVCCMDEFEAWFLSLPAGLPDGLFSNQKSQIWVNFGGPLNGI